MVSTLTLIPAFATFSTLVLRVRPRNTPAHLAFGSMSSEVSATGLLRPRGLAALKVNAYFDGFFKTFFFTLSHYLLAAALHSW